MRYDDGTSDVPGGITRPVERVLVVGAGIAGLAVANAMAHAGVECVVLEARDRIGGRLHTVDLGGVPVDLGGSWIHQPDGNPLTALAADFGVTCTPGNPVPRIGGYDAAEGRRVGADEMRDVLEVQFDRFPAALDSLREELGRQASGLDGIDAFLRSSGLTGAAARRNRQNLLSEVEAAGSDLAKSQSLQWLFDEREYGGDYLGDLPDGGYRALVDAVATGVDVRLSAPVTGVRVGGNGVQLQCADGEVHDGSHVVVAVPLGVLKRGGLSFAPALPADRLAVIDRLGFGRYEKVCLSFAEPFWREAGVSHTAYFSGDADEAAGWMIDHDAFGAGAAVTFHVFPSLAVRVLAEGVEGAKRWAMDELGGATGRPCPEPTAVAVTSWADDPWTGGTYTHVPVGAEPADLDRLGEPVADRILFAGEHTQSARIGYADGAFTSGIREAKRLIGSPRVDLGPIRPLRA